MRHWVLTFLLACAVLSADIPYEVQFLGVDDSDTLALLQSASQLATLRECPPTTPTALQRRAEAETPHILEVMHGRAYFDADVQLNIDFQQQPALVTFQITPGRVYTFKEFRLLSSTSIEEEESDEEEETDLLPDEFENYEEIDLKDLGIDIGAPAYPNSILEAEKAVVDYLEEQGYPLAEIIKRDVTADRREKSVTAWVYVNSGPLAYFGSTHISGLRSVGESFVRRKIAWQEGVQYDPNLLQCTFNALDSACLFASIEIRPKEDLQEGKYIPIEIELTESPHRSIGFGASYTTQWGGGLLAEWEHRNIRGIGERLTLKGELLQREQMAAISYIKPDFLCEGLEWMNRVEAEHEITEGFHETSGTLTTRLSRKLTCNLWASGGAALKVLRSTDSDNNRNFLLAKLPLQLNYNNTGSVLDPCSGTSLNLRLVPAYELRKPQFGYTTLLLDLAEHLTLLASPGTVFAGKLTVGSIMGASRISVPPPERFYAGSPQLLRGYRFMTVSPLDAAGKPIGGRSILVLSLELRQRFGEDWGGVLFYEVGNVYANIIPELWHKQLQSVGVGVRYYTAVGPLRLDVGFPLNRRHIDGRFQVYFSIGQTF